MLNLRQDIISHKFIDNVGHELVGSVVGAALRLAEAQVAARDRDEGFARRVRHRQVRVVLVAVHVQVVLRPLLAELG